MATVTRVVGAGTDLMDRPAQWFQPGNITADDNNYAICSMESDLSCSDDNIYTSTLRGDGVPDWPDLTGATINSIAVKVRVKENTSSSPGFWSFTSLVKAGAQVGSPKSDGILSSSETLKTITFNAAEVAAAGITGADINSAFGFDSVFGMGCCDCDPTTVTDIYVDDKEITIDYTPAPAGAQPRRMMRGVGV